MVALDRQRRLISPPMRHQSPMDLRRLLEGLRPDAVAIDSPPRFIRSGSSRECERALMRLGIQCYATPSEAASKNHFYDWMREGHKAFRVAQDTGYELYLQGRSVRNQAIEVFPHASAVVLRGKLPPHGWSRKRALKKKWRENVLRSRGVDTEPLVSLDEVDAALAALTGLLALEGAFLGIGDSGDGIIVLPVKKVDGRFSREVREVSPTSP